LDEPEETDKKMNEEGIHAIGGGFKPTIDCRPPIYDLVGDTGPVWLEVRRLLPSSFFLR
jgi:hypothetical protein